MAVVKPPQPTLVYRGDKADNQKANRIIAGAVNNSKGGNQADVAVTVRVPPEVLEQVDASVERRRAQMRLRTFPRHGWLLEAIYEKLDREKGK